MTADQDVRGCRHAVGLEHISDAKTRQRGKQSEQHRQPLPPRAHTHFDVVHWPTMDLTPVIDLAIHDRERAGRKLGRHPDHRRDPHPEHGTGSTSQDRGRDTNDISGADRRR